MATSEGQVESRKYSHTKGVDISIIDQQGVYAVHWAAGQGHTDVIKRLVDAGVSINTQDKSGETAVHVATRLGYSGAVEFLCTAGADINTGDNLGDTALHCAARHAHADIVQFLCENQANLNIQNKDGYTPFHLACKSGQAEIARYLLLVGADSEILDKDGLTGGIIALAHGFTKIAEMAAFCKGMTEKFQSCVPILEQEKRLELINQLTPTTEPISRVKLKLLGASGVGKTTLVESLKVGLLGSLFKRKSGSMAPKRKISGQQFRQFSLPSALTYKLRNPAYTRGVDIQTLSIAGSGEFSVWEFSGYEPYYIFYDHFLGDVDCIHVVLFSLEESLDEQMVQLVFWLQFLKARMQIKLPLEFCGKPRRTAEVIMVATNADRASTPCYKTGAGLYASRDSDHILDKVITMFQHDLHICPTLYLLNTQQPSSADMKALKQQIGKMKTKLLKRLQNTTGLLSAVVGVMPEWQESFHACPVLSWSEFVDQVQTFVNPLASDADVKLLDLQLQYMGEIVRPQGHSDLVVVNPQWLATDVLGGLLCQERIMMSRITGCFSLDEVQLMYPDTDAQSLLQVLAACSLCTQCEVEGHVVFEFPCLNFVETLPELWLKDETPTINCIYGGVRLHTSVESGSQLKYLFPRIQVCLRRRILSRNEGNMKESNDKDAKPKEQDNKPDLYQWHRGSKYCCGSLEGIVEMDKNEQYLEIKVRGPEDQRENLFYFLDDFINTAEQALANVCPGLCVMRNILSPSQLKEHGKVVRSYSPTELHRMQLDDRSSVVLSGDLVEDFRAIAFFGSAKIARRATLGMDLPGSCLTIHCHRLLSLLLDAPESMGKDWCLLAATVGLGDFLPSVEAANAGKRHRTSPTQKVLNEWTRRHPHASVRQLVGHLKEIGRLDAVEAILRTTPIFKMFPHMDRSTESLKRTRVLHSQLYKHII